MQGIKHFFLAVQYFTRIPLPRAWADWVGFSPALLQGAAGHLPGVGLLIGTAAALAYAGLALSLALGPYTSLVAAVLSTALTVWLTGGLHEDGLADTADGLGGSMDRDKALAIMKDPRIGAMGAMTLVLALLAKVSLLAMLGQASLYGTLLTLVWAHTLSRAWVLISMWTLPRVSQADTSKSKGVSEGVGLPHVRQALVWVVLSAALLWAVALVLPSHGWGQARAEQALLTVWAATLASGLAWAWMHGRLRARLGGHTGDGLGAAQQLAELGTYLGVAWALGQ